MTKIIIAGLRKYDNYDFFQSKLGKILKDYGPSQLELVSGGATGIDTYAEIFAKQHQIPIKVFPANWGKYGNAAGPIRNKQMADYVGSSGILIAFWNYHSRGTGNMIQIAEERKMTTIIVDIRNGEIRSKG